MKWEFGDIVNGEAEVDPLLGLSCFMLGFKRYDILDYVSDQWKNGIDDPAEILRKKLYYMSKGYDSVFQISGALANETAIKIADDYQRRLGGDRNIIVTIEMGYHGNSFLTDAMTLGKITDLNNIYNIKRDFSNPPDWDKVSCIIFETRQWNYNMVPYPEGDNNFSPNNFWLNIEKAQENGVLIIVDDIFFGGGKTGNFFGWESLPIEPDICTMGKAITGGYFPLSIVLINKKFDIDHNLFEDSYFSKSGILSCLKYIDILETEKYLEIENIKSLQTRVEEIFSDGGPEDKGPIDINFGTVYVFDIDGMLQVPFNANEEYFERLKKWKVSLYENLNMCGWMDPNIYGALLESKKQRNC